MSAWTTERPTTAGWYWVRWPKDRWLGPEIVCITQPNGPDTGDLEVDDMPLEEYIAVNFTPEWQPVALPKD